MALGYSFKPRNILWLPALAALSVWGLALWYWGGPHHNLYDQALAARSMLSEIVMAYDDAVQRKDIPQWQRPLAEGLSRGRLAGLEQGLRGSPVMSDALEVDFALVYHHLAVESGDTRWNAWAKRALAAVRDKEHGSYYYYPVEAVLQSRALTAAERTSLAASCAKWPTDWFIVQLAHAFGMDDKVSHDVLAARERRAGRQQLLYFVLGGAMVLSGLILAWPLWRVWRGSKPQMGPRPRDHRRHLRRLWSAAPTLICFSLAGGFWVAIGASATPLAKWVASLLSSQGSAAHAWIVITIWLPCSLLSLLAWPLAMCWCMAPELGKLRKVFDLRRVDFTNWRWWFIGIAGSAVILDANVLLGFVAKWLGVSISASDHLSRTFTELGSFSLPFSILWGAVLAPCVEELLFRGFLFTAFRNQFGFWWAAVLSSLLFAGPHFYGWVGTVGVFLYGLLFCLIYQRTQRLASTMILHACVNFPLLILSWLEWSA